MHKYGAWQMLMKMRGAAFQSQLVLAVMQNAILMINHSFAIVWIEDQVDKGDTRLSQVLALVYPLLRGKWWQASNGATGLNLWLGVLQCLSCVIIFIITVFTKFPNRQNYMWTEEFGVGYQEALKRSQVARVGYTRGLLLDCVRRHRSCLGVVHPPVRRGRPRAVCRQVLFLPSAGDHESLEGAGASHTIGDDTSKSI